MAVGVDLLAYSGIPSFSGLRSGGFVNWFDDEGVLMGDTHDDPTDHSRTTQPHAGIALKDNLFWPGLVLLTVGLFGLISTAVVAAYRQYEWLSATVLIALLGEVAGALWLAVEVRRVARIEAQWEAAHPDRLTRSRTD